MKVLATITLLLVLGTGAYVYIAYKPVWQFAHLERNARRVITPAELQTWATNLLSTYTTNSRVRLSELGTNFPRQLCDLAPKLGPFIIVYDGYETNSPRWVRLDWGSGFAGARGFEIGPTNFVSLRPGNRWAPGVYFYYK